MNCVASKHESLTCEEFASFAAGPSGDQEDAAEVIKGSHAMRMTPKDPVPMTLYDQLRLSRLKAQQERTSAGHRKAYSEFNLASLSATITAEDIGSAVKEESSSHPFFNNQEGSPTLSVTTNKPMTASSPRSVVPGAFDGMLQSLSLDSNRRRAQHRRNKTEVPIPLTFTPSKEDSIAKSSASTLVTTTLAEADGCRGKDDDDLRRRVRQLESIVAGQATEIKQLRREINEWKARAEARR